QSTDHRALYSADAQDGGHIFKAGGFGIGVWVALIVALAMTAHIPHDHLVAVQQRGDLAVPHAAGRAIAVRQQDRGPMSMHLVMNCYAVAVEPGHGQFPPLLLAGKVARTAVQWKSRQEP